MSHPEVEEQIFEEDGSVWQALPSSFHQNLSLPVGTRLCSLYYLIWILRRDRLIVSAPAHRAVPRTRSIGPCGGATYPDSFVHLHHRVRDLSMRHSSKIPGKMHRTMINHGRDQSGPYRKRKICSLSPRRIIY